MSPSCRNRIVAASPDDTGVGVIQICSYRAGVAYSESLKLKLKEKKVLHRNNLLKNNSVATT